MTVYVTNEQSRFNYLPAQQFGELEFVTSRVYSFNNQSVNVDVLEGVTKMAKDFNPNTDFLLPSGSAISTGLCFAALALKGHSRIPVLVWSSNDACYVAGVVNF